MRRAAVLVLVLLLGCPSEQSTQVDPPAPPVSSGSIDVDTGSGDGTLPVPPQTPRVDDGKNQLALREKHELKVGGVPLTVYLANTDQSRRLGLMNVKEPLPDQMGMLFVYPRASRLAFYMKNTYIPLSLAYVAEDGTIAQLVDMHPLDERSHRAESVVRFVIEVNQGWFQAHGVTAGAKVEGLAGLVGYD